MNGSYTSLKRYYSQVNTASFNVVFSKIPAGGGWEAVEPISAVWGEGDSPLDALVELLREMARKWLREEPYGESFRPIVEDLS